MQARRNFKALEPISKVSDDVEVVPPKCKITPFLEGRVSPRPVVEQKMASDPELKLCVIGARGHGASILRALKAKPHVSLAGISSGCADPIDALAGCCREFAGHLPAPPVFDDWRRMLDRAQPDIVCVDGPFELHAQMCAESFQRNIHVIVEKPAALTLDDLRLMHRAYREFQPHFTAMMNSRYNQAFQAAWNFTQTGRLGPIRLINAQKSYVLGQRRDFFKQRATFGGTIPWVGSHAIDWLRWYSGAEFESVAAYHTRASNRGHGDLESGAVAVFKMAGEILATVTIDYLRPKSAGSHGDDRVRIVGANGFVEVRDGRTCAAYPDGEGIIDQPPAAPGALFSDFVDQIAGRGVCRIPARDVFSVTEACLLARQSADESRPLDFTAGPWRR